MSVRNAFMKVSLNLSVSVMVCGTGSNLFSLSLTVSFQICMAT